MSDRRHVATFCAQCRSRCGCKVLVQNKRIVDIKPQPSHPSGKAICPKGKAIKELVYHENRLTSPMRRTSPKGQKLPTWEPISWEEAMTEFAHQLARIRDKHGAEQVAFSVTTPSGTQISDSISWIERLIRAYGSPNSIYSTEICNWHKDMAAKFTYGSDIGIPDFSNTDCVLLWGHNPATTWLARSLEVQKAIRRGAKMIVVDPRPTPFAKRANCWLQVRPGTDQVLALGITNLMLTSGRFDVPFVRQWTNATFLVRDDTGAFLRQSDVEKDGCKEIIMAAGPRGQELLKYNIKHGQWQSNHAIACLMDSRPIKLGTKKVICKTALQVLAEAAAEYPAPRVAEITGVSTKQLEMAADILAESDSTAYYAWNGVGQSVTATQTDRAISILYSLTGSYGKVGGNVPGAAARFNDISGHDLLSKTQRRKALGLKKRPIGPGLFGWVTARDVYDAVLLKEPYPIRALVSFGGNLLAAQPDPEKAKRAFAKLDFHVHVDFFLNATAEYADIVLPAATSWEREGLRTGFDVSLQGMRKVQLKPAVIAPIGNTRSDTDIVLDLAKRLGLSDVMFNCNADLGYAHILAPSGVTLKELKAHPEGIILPGSVQLSAYRESGFATPTKRLEIYSEHLMQNGYTPVPSLKKIAWLNNEEATYPLLLSSAKTLAYCHSQGRNIASLRRITPDPILEISLKLAENRDIKPGDWVEVSTQVGSFIARAKLSKEITADSVFAQHGWTVSSANDTPNHLDDPLATNINQTIETKHSDPISGSIPLRSSWCNIRKV